MAQAAAQGADKSGAEVRLRKVAELAAPAAIQANPGWAKHLTDTADIPQASLDDLEWADPIPFGTPTRFGNPASQLRAFIDTTGRLWFQGKLPNHVARDGAPSEVTRQAARYQERRLVDTAASPKARPSRPTTSAGVPVRGATVAASQDRSRPLRKRARALTTDRCWQASPQSRTASALIGPHRRQQEAGRQLERWRVVWPPVSESKRFAW